MLTFDIAININITANSEEEAEAIAERLFINEMKKPALQRNINTWDFIEFVTEEEYDKTPEL
jgi:hypothetical protein